MIFIDNKKFRPSKLWLRKARKHLKVLIKYNGAGQPQERNNYIDARHYVWTEIKQGLITATVNKCWFTEGTSEVAHLHIEHFRPKKEVKLLNKKHNCAEGRAVASTECYWWLAFSYKNYRISGALINSYKGNFFPLQPGSFVGNSKNDNVSLETPILLDPTVKTDCDLLSFDINGDPFPTANVTTHPYEFQRAQLSIYLYGLKDDLIVTARKRKLQDLNLAIKKIDRYYHLSLGDPLNVALKEVLTEECSYLVAMTNMNQPFSKMVKSRLQLIPYQWAIDLVHPFLK
ncbi:MAG TPA: hypothetical protein VK508_12740 [Cyclobacteriaceae bacterium]|nr:hypothetical protein [Cyclobacteriaceae bacterium]